METTRNFNNENDFDEIPDSELLRRIYINQLRLQMELETIRGNVVELQKKINPESEKNPYQWRHLSEINKDMNSMYSEFYSQLRRKRQEEK